MRILVVDDHPDVLVTIEALLTRMDHLVATAGTGSDALEMFEASRFDVLITDRKMPGMSGDELLRRVRAAYPEVATVLITGEWLSAGEPCEWADAFLTKPMLPNDIRAALEVAQQRADRRLDER